MKNIVLKKTLIFSMLMTLMLCISAYADEISDIEKYGPSLASYTVEKKELPVGTVVYDSPLGATIINSSTANQISQIAIVDSSNPLIGSSPATVAARNSNADNPTNLITNPTAADLINPYGTGNTLPTDGSAYVLPSGLNLYNLVVKNTTATKPTISAPSYALINVTTNQIYDMKNQTEKYNPSGLANLMTAYIAVSSSSLDKELKVNSTAVYNIDKDASIIALSNKDKITLKDAIASMFVKGAVDSANVIAENVSGNIDAFVNLMNATALSLGMQNTKFVDPAGIKEGNETTALDMAILMAKVTERPELVELLALSTYTLPQVERREQLIIYSKNSQLNRESANYNADVVASRMAYTTASKYTIASLMNYNNNKIIAVVLKAEGSQFSDTKKLLEFAKVAVAE
ncbi:MAG: D-alanyl-D-alanine carboxypeptidase [Lachnospiraceae bacterium]|nr:D-alanyl-D-alanine carboxypeptidase [Lachnospiraceae bacterium]